jgi:lysophospholipase L1-like esterase
MMDAVWPSWALNALDHPGVWEWQIRLYERRDRRSAPLTDGILFTGSSSINLWSTLAEDMAPLPVLNRGFGGAHLDHVNRYAARIVFPYRPKLIALYAGENDLSGWSNKTPESVTADFEHFVELVARELPETRILFLSLKPSLLRSGLADEQRELNERVEKVTASDDRLGFLDVGSPLLDASGAPRRELFRMDRLHLNDAGYCVWTAAIRPRLEQEWRDLTD